MIEMRAKLLHDLVPDNVSSCAAHACVWEESQHVSHRRYLDGLTWSFRLPHQLGTAQHAFRLHGTRALRSVSSLMLHLLFDHVHMSCGTLAVCGKNTAFSCHCCCQACTSAFSQNTGVHIMCRLQTHVCAFSCVFKFCQEHAMHMV